MATAASGAADRADQLRGALTGALIGSGAGIAWGIWGSSGLGGAAALAAAVLSVAAGVALIVLNRRADRALAALTGGREAPPTRFGLTYWLIVAAEVVAIFVGTRVVSGTGHGAARAPWICLVVGLHFVLLGRLWQAPPVLILAAVLSVLGAVMLVVAFAGGPLGTVTAVTGLLAAVAFFVSAGWAVAAARTAAVA